MEVGSKIDCVVKEVPVSILMMLLLVIVGVQWMQAAPETRFVADEVHIERFTARPYCDVQMQFTMGLPCAQRSSQFADYVLNSPPIVLSLAKIYRF